MYNVAGGSTYRLQSSIGLTNTSIPLSSFLEPITGTPYTMAFLNTDICYGTLDPQQPTRSEFISFTGITQNSDGTALLTGVTRGLGRSSPFTPDLDNVSPHSGQSIFILSDAPGVWNEFAKRRNDEDITGYWDFPTPVADSNPATKEYVDDLVNGGPVSVQALVEVAVAGENVVSANLSYLKSTDGRWYKTDADVAATVLNVKLGIVQGTGVTAGSIAGGVLTAGRDTKNTGFTPGATLYASNTAGGISTSPGTFSRKIGVADASGNLIFDTYFPTIPTDTEKIVIANLATALLPYAASAVGTDAYAITPSPAISGYVNGQQFKFKADVANTGPATLNASALGAVAITKYNDQPLQTGDIEANQIITVTYNSTGPVFQMDSQLANNALVYTSGVITRDVSASNGAVTTAHGLGVIPRYIKITGLFATSSIVSSSSGSYNGSATASIFNSKDTGSTPFADGNSTSVIISIYNGDTSGGQTAVATFDATNITLTWTKIGSVSGTANILWEAYT